MILYTSQDEKLIFNRARNIATSSLIKTLDELFGLEGVKEKDLAARWLSNMKEDRDIYAAGWYCPPPKGMAVLTGKRLNFDSLRNEKYWPNDTVIDWKEGYLYAYCSPVDKLSGLIGDMSVTLYFGEDEKVKNHFRNCRRAAEEIFEDLAKVKDPCELYRDSLKIFNDKGLLSNVISATDSSPSNLGHTFTYLKDKKDKKELSKEDIGQLSHDRRFLNGEDDFEFEEGMQFTIEPQLLSLEDKDLFKVTHHFVVQKRKDDFIVCNDIDVLLKRFDLI